MPLKGRGNDGNRPPTNVGTCPEAGTGTDTGARPVGVPSRLNSSNITDAAEAAGFATAIPLSMGEDAADSSTNIRKAVPKLAGAAASVAVTPLDRFWENN